MWVESEVEVEIECWSGVGDGFDEGACFFGTECGIDAFETTMPQSQQVPVALRASVVAALTAFASIDIPSASTAVIAVFAAEEGEEEACWRWHVMRSFRSSKIIISTLMQSL